MSGPVGLVLPMPDAPFLAEQVEERTRTAPDGALTTNVVANRVYRDSAGRVRIEWSVSPPPAAAHEVVYLIDPVSSSATVLFVGPKVAYRTAVPRSSTGGFQVGFPMVGEPFPEAESQMKTENLGMRITEGVEVQGTRTTTTAQGKPLLTALRETWSSQTLGLTLTVEASGPGWRHTANRKRPANPGGTHQTLGARLERIQSAGWTRMNRMSQRTCLPEAVGRPPAKVFSNISRSAISSTFIRIQLGRGRLLEPAIWYPNSWTALLRTP